MNAVPPTGAIESGEPLTADDIFGSSARSRRPEPEPSPSAVSDVLEALRRGKWIVGGCLAAALGLAILYLARTPPEFSAAAQVILEPRRLTQQEMVGGSSAALDSAQAESQMQVMKSERILATVFETLNLAESPEFAHPPPGLRQRALAALRQALPPLASALVSTEDSDAEAEHLRAFQAFTDRVSVRRIGQSYVLELTYRAPGAVEAARLANSLTAAYIHSQIERKLAAARRGAEFLENRVASLEAEEGAAAAAIRDGVMPTVSLPDAESRVISATREPLSKSAPQTMLVLGFACAVGLLVGGGILAARYSLDRRVRSAGQIWRHFGLPCLAMLPMARRRGARRLPFDLVVSDARSPYARALRTAYTAVVTRGSRDAPFRSLGIASWNSGEGKSTLAGNLAHFIAATGEPVRLIDADLQDPVLSEGLSPQATGGLCEALTEHVDLARLEPQMLRRDLGFVPARGRYEPYQPNLFLGAPAVGRFLARLQEGGDVVVDLPAMERSPHAQAMAGFLDGIILVVESGRTTFEEVAFAIRSLEGARAKLLGIVLNKGSGRVD